jgi:hypothetical protein
MNKAAAPQPVESPGADQHWRRSLCGEFLQKELTIFCDGRVFFVDRILLMGATHKTIWN